MGVSEATRRFALEIGEQDAVWIGGAGTRRRAPEGVRVVHPPAGVNTFRPEEMTVSCGAGTTLRELDAVLGQRGQYVNLGQRRHCAGTVGGALATGWNDHLRLGRGPIRDSLLEAHLVDGDARVVKAGGPTVKNVSGFDLCRLIVGSQGRLGAVAEVILRTRPLPASMRWFRVDDVDADRIGLVTSRLHRPAAVLWDGLGVDVCLEGHDTDIDAAIDDLSRVGASVVESDPEPEPNRFAHRWSLAPSAVSAHVTARAGEVLAEVGVGVVHAHEPPPTRVLDPASAEIHRRLLDAFDPRRRLNPGTEIAPGL